MAAFKEALLQEQSRLEKILQMTVESLKGAPKGTLRLSRTRKWSQFYHCMPDEKKGGTYIPRKNEELIRQLAQKSYDEKILKLVETRLAQIRKLLGDYDDREIEKVFLNEHRERQKWIRPVEPSWEQQLAEWMSEDYKKKEFQEGAAVILTDRGERVRSKSEKILADYFCRQGIQYKYERPLYLKGFGIVYPDFTFLSGKTKQEIYWEHNGLMDDPDYAQNAIRKIHAYEENNIFPGERLIISFETKKTVLDTKMVERLVYRYLLS